MALREDEKRLILECIESYKNMIEHQKKQIADLQQKLDVVEKFVDYKTFDVEVKK